MSTLLTVPVCARCGASDTERRAAFIAKRGTSPEQCIDVAACVVRERAARTPDITRAALTIAIEQAAALCDARATSEEITAERVAAEFSKWNSRYGEAIARAQTARELADAIRSMK